MRISDWSSDVCSSDLWTLYSHNQLYGVWRIADAGERPDTKRSLRVALETTRKSILLHSASDVAMRRSSDRAVIPAEARTTIERELPGRSAPCARSRPRRESHRAHGALLREPWQRFNHKDEGPSQPTLRK